MLRQSTGFRRRHTMTIRDLVVTRPAFLSGYGDFIFPLTLFQRRPLLLPSASLPLQNDSHGEREITRSRPSRFLTSEDVTSQFLRHVKATPSQQIRFLEQKRVSSLVRRRQQRRRWRSVGFCFNSQRANFRDCSLLSEAISSVFSSPLRSFLSYDLTTWQLSEVTRESEWRRWKRG